MKRHLLLMLARRMETWSTCSGEAFETRCWSFALSSFLPLIPASMCLEQAGRRCVPGLPDPLSWMGYLHIKKNLSHTSGPLHVWFSFFGLFSLHITCLSPRYSIPILWSQCKPLYSSWPLLAPPHVAWSPYHAPSWCLAFLLPSLLIQMSFLSSGLWAPRGEGPVCDGSPVSRAWQKVNAELQFCWMKE